MPKIKIDHVLSFSSEDPVHIANNILNNDSAKKWKCKEAGEKAATIVLQLEKACVISAIDIGNENSAYVEVLVSRSGANDDYKVLLVMSSFMTPLEARQTTNTHKVRMFTHEQLSKPENDQKWDRVKIVCTQPFNKHVQFGLSFITLHTPLDKTNGAPVTPTIGRFALRPESPDNLSAGSLFARRNTESKKETFSVAAAIRAASASPAPKPKLKINATPSKDNGELTKALPRNRNELLYSKDEEEPNEKIDKIIEKKQKEEESKKLNEEKKKETIKQSKRKSETEPSTSKKIKIEEKVRKVLKPFNELLKGVTLVISGIQNPDRGNLRTMALSLGAKYKADWDNSCTHLVCAFTNTPKFNQVKGKGKIVKRNWIEDCHAQRRRLPWRRYCLDKADSKKPESEDEIWEKIEDVESDGDLEGFDDTKMQKRIEELQAEKEKKGNTLFSLDTDEEVLSGDEVEEISNKLPEFFDFKTFFIDKTLDEDITDLLERYIIAYKGVLVEKPSDDVDYFITSENNAENLKTKNSSAICLRPDWLWDCHNSQKCVPTVDYVL